MSERKALKLIVRGHIRSSFDDQRLKGLVDKLQDIFDLTVYVQTWSVFQNSISWRRLEAIPREVRKSDIESYLAVPIKSIQIIDDQSIKHIGNVEGNIGKTPCPIVGWKNMYYGMMAAASRAFYSEGPDEVGMQMRFDILSNPFSPSEHEIIEFANREYGALKDNPADDERIRFLRMRCFLGVDNMYMARVADMHRFISYMYYDMDRILHVHRRTIHQEHIAFHERRSFFDWVPPGNLVERLLRTNEMP